MIDIADVTAGEIRAEMARQRLSQMDLAQRLGISQAKLSRALNGKVPLTLDFIQSVADALGVPFGALLITDSSLTPISDDAAMLGAA